MNQGTILPTGVRTAALGVAVILFALFSTAARADTVIGNVTLGPNTGTLFQGGGGSGCGGIGATVTLMTSDPLNPGVTVTGNSPCTVALTGGSFGTYIATVTAAPGFRIDDVSFSTACGVSGIGATAGFTLSTPGSTLSGNCPSLPSGQFGLVGPVSTSFAPVNSYTETLTLFGRIGHAPPTANQLLAHPSSGTSKYPTGGRRACGPGHGEAAPDGVASLSTFSERTASSRPG